MALEKLIGKEITITIKNHSAALHGPFAYCTPTSVDLVGVVQKRPAWDRDNDNVHFIVDDKVYQINRRIITIKDILKINGADFVQPTAEVDREFLINGSRGNHQYKVTVKNGYWKCTCVAGSFNKLCRHINQAKEMK